MPRIPDYPISLLVQILQTQLFSRLLKYGRDQAGGDQVNADSG